MKNLRFADFLLPSWRVTSRTLLGLSLALTVAACSKDDASSSSNNPPASTAKLSWTEGGRNFESTDAMKNAASGQVALYGTSPNAAGTDRNVVSMLFPLTVGTYVIGNNPPTTLATLVYSLGTAAGVPSYTASGATGNGTITVTAVSPKLEGTFTLTVVNSTDGSTKSLTNGRFSL